MPNPGARARAEREAREWFEERHATNPINTMPRLPPECYHAWECFNDLTNQREIVVVAGMGGGATFQRAIPYLTFSQWCRDRGIYGHDLEQLWSLIRRIDARYVSGMNRGSRDE